MMTMTGTVRAATEYDSWQERRGEVREYLLVSRPKELPGKEDKSHGYQQENHHRGQTETLLRHLLCR